MLTDRELMQQIADDQKLIVEMLSYLTNALAGDDATESVTDMDGKRYPASDALLAQTLDAQ